MLCPSGSLSFMKLVKSISILCFGETVLDVINEVSCSVGVSGEVGVIGEVGEGNVLMFCSYVLNSSSIIGVM